MLSAPREEATSDVGDRRARACRTRRLSPGYHIVIGTIGPIGTIGALSEHYRIDSQIVTIGTIGVLSEYYRTIGVRTCSSTIGDRKSVV